MPYWNFEYTKAVIYTVGGGIGQDPATEVTYLRLNQPPVFSSVNLTLQNLGADGMPSITCCLTSTYKQTLMKWLNKNVYTVYQKLLIVILLRCFEPHWNWQNNSMIGIVKTMNKQRTVWTGGLRFVLNIQECLACCILSEIGNKEIIM